MILKNSEINGIITDIKISNGKITDIGTFHDDAECIDLHGYEIYPGLIDIHSHGCIGYDTMDMTALDKMSLCQASCGITSWLPTTMTMSYSSIKSVTNQDIENISGANILGFHMEGPYISPKYKGAQNEAFIKPPDINEFNTLKNIKMVTIAPEIDKSMDFIEKCNAVISLGHTDADFTIGDEAFKKGANCLTHTLNAMAPFHHRNPSVVGAAIENDAYVQVISDGLHLHKTVVIALYRIFGSDRMILISDSMRATGMSDGQYEFGGQEIIVKDGIAKTLDGAIAGSTTNLLDCVKTAIKFGIPKKDAFKMASATPAALLGEKNKGRIEVGADADIIVTDNNQNLMLSMVGGKIYKNII